VLASLPDILEAAGRERRAAGGFTAYDIATAVAVTRAAEARGVGVVLIVSAQAFAARTGPALVAALRAEAERARVPACVQLDHVADLGAMERALAAGATALMADGSTLPYEENVGLVRAAAELAARHGAAVEAELGRVEGDEEIALAAAAGALTDPGQAADFMARTGADCLAVSIGNVHGAYRRPPQLDWPRLAAVRRAIPHPLSLHGASGLPAEALSTAIAHGVTKVNVNTELRRRWLQAVGEGVAAAGDGANLLALQGRLVDAVGEAVEAKLAELAGAAGQPTRSSPV
jgi:tagatose 1,6-diphosphate aldolase GatY/KbaY